MFHIASSAAIYVCDLDFLPIRQLAHESQHTILDSLIYNIIL